MNAIDEPIREFEPTAEMAVWIESLIDGDLAPEQHAAFARLLMEDEVLRQCFLDEMQIHAAIEWDGLEPFDTLAEAAFSEKHSSFPVIFPSAALHGPVGYFSSDWTISYLIATVILGIGALIGAYTYVSQPVEVAGRTSVVQQEHHETHWATEPQLTFVGKITGMVDCRWLDPSTAPISANVVLGHKYSLASGLMEITYDVGAKVILQGPVQYEVESKDGGFLSLGKLTAKLEKRAEGGGRKAEGGGRRAEDRNLPSPSGRGAGGEGRWTRDSSAQTQTALTLALSRKERGPNSNPSSALRLPPSALFSVRTPTAMIADLGTEFGVEVNKSGATTSHVFDGVVEVQTVDDDGKPGKAVRLTENQSVQVKRESGGARTRIVRVTSDPSAFVRPGELPKYVEEMKLKPFRRWQAYSEELRKDPSLLAYYDFQQVAGSPAVLRNVAANGDKSLDGVVEGANWTTDRMAGKHALEFYGPNCYVQTNLPQKVEDLTLVAWVNLSMLNDMNGLLMSDDWKTDGEIHWQLSSKGHMVLGVHGDHGPGYLSTPFADRGRYLFHWTHLAVVYDHAAGRVRFYVDGDAMDEAQIAKHFTICIGEAHIAQWCGTRQFHGRIDELAIFGRPLKSDEIQRMYEAGKPTNNKTQP